MARRGVHHVESAEHETLLHTLEACRHLAQMRGQGLALRPGLRVADPVRRMDAALTIPIGSAQSVQALVGGVDEVLFGQRKIRV